MIQFVTLQTYCAPKKIKVYFDTVYHATAHYTTQLLYGIFGIEKVFSSMNTLPAFQKMLVSPTEFRTGTLGRITRPFKIHS